MSIMTIVNPASISSRNFLINPASISWKKLANFYLTQKIFFINGTFI